MGRSIVRAAVGSGQPSRRLVIRLRSVIAEGRDGRHGTQHLDRERRSTAAEPHGVVERLSPRERGRERAGERVAGTGGVHARASGGRWSPGSCAAPRDQRSVEPERHHDRRDELEQGRDEGAEGSLNRVDRRRVGRKRRASCSFTTSRSTRSSSVGRQRPGRCGVEHDLHAGSSSCLCGCADGLQRDLELQHQDRLPTGRDRDHQSSELVQRGIGADLRR